MKKPPKKAAEQTNLKYTAEISSLTRLKDTQINRLFPKRTDKEKLMKLLAIVKDSTDEAEKKARLLENIEDLSPILIRLVGVLV